MWHSTVLLLSLALGLVSVQGASHHAQQHTFPKAPTREPYDYCQAGYLDPKSYPIPTAKGAVLEHVQVVIRHGDRGSPDPSPVHIIPQDNEVSWDCSDINTYAFSDESDGKKPPSHRAHLIVNQESTIPQSSPWAQNFWQGSCFLGQLTSVGARQHQRLGQVLKAVYIDQLSLLNKTLDPDTVYFRATDYPRTKQSAENLLIGLFTDPDESSGKAATASPPPMVKLHYYPSEIDTFFKNGEACPAIKHLEKKIFGQSKVLETLAKNNAQFKKDLNRIFGVNPALPEWNPKRPEWAAPMDIVHARLCHDLPQPCEPTSGHKLEEDDVTTENKKHKKPNCITHEMIERIQDNAFTFAAETRRDAKGAHKLMRLVAGPLVSDMRQDLAHARHKGPIRFTLFSGHDDTVTSVLGVLKSKDIRWPPYASNVLFELWKVPCENTYHGCGSTDNDDYFVRVFYNGAVVDADWCDLSWCPYDTFIGYLDSFIPKDLHAECHMKDEL